MFVDLKLEKSIPFNVRSDGKNARGNNTHNHKSTVEK